MSALDGHDEWWERERKRVQERMWAVEDFQSSAERLDRELEAQAQDLWHDGWEVEEPIYYAEDAWLGADADPDEGFERARED